MALPPPIPLRPDDRPETWDEYQQRRSIIAMWRHIGDLIGADHFLRAFRPTIPPWWEPRLGGQVLPVPHVTAPKSTAFLQFLFGKSGPPPTVKGTPIKWDWPGDRLLGRKHDFAVVDEEASLGHTDVLRGEWVRGEDGVVIREPEWPPPIPPGWKPTPPIRTPGSEKDPVDWGYSPETKP
jgi:hypothetical protein